VSLFCPGRGYRVPTINPEEMHAKPAAKNIPEIGANNRIHQAKPAVW